MKEREKSYEGEKLLNLAEGLRKSDVVSKIVENLADSFAEQIDLIMKITMIDFDAERFLEDKEYNEKILTDCYMLKYPYLSKCEFEGCELVSAWLELYNASELPGLPISLQSLNIYSCYYLENLSGLEGCENLQVLEVANMDNLTSLSGIEGCKNLQCLKVYDCDGLTSLSGLEGCASLMSLFVKNCYSFESLSGIEACKSLQSLEIFHSYKLESLSGIEACENLQSLKVGSCNNLECLTGIEACENLERLAFKSCSSSIRLSGIESLKNLKSFRFEFTTLALLDSESKEILKRLEENPDVEVVLIDLFADAFKFV